MKTKLLAILLSVAFVVSGCQAAARQAEGTYTTGTSAGDAETLNWLIAADSASFSYAGQTLDSLASYDNDFKVHVRHAAKPIEVSPDGLVYTITIRDYLKWSDGTSVTAEDYVYTLKNLMFSDWLNYTYQSDWQEEVDGKSVFVEPKVVNATTFTITRKTVEPEFMDNALMGLTPYPKNIAQKYEGNVKAFTEAEEFNKLTYTGNLGPFKFEEWVRNDKFVVSRNPDFYLSREDKGTPFFQKYVIKLFGTPAARMAALEAGDITSSAVDPPQVAKFMKLPELNVYTTPTSGYEFLAFNMRSNGWEGLRQKEVRQAISMAISKETIVKDILLGFGEPAFSFLPKVSPWYTEEGVTKYGVGPLYNKEKSREMLVKAGYGTKKADGSFQVTGKDGKPLKLVLTTNVGNETREKMAALIKQELTDMGIEVDLKLVPFATLLGNYLRNKEPGTDQEPGFNNGPRAVSQESWDLLVLGFSTNPIAPSGQEVFFTTKGGLNAFGYFNEKMDQLFRRVKSKEALDPKARKAMYQEISAIIADEQPVDFLTFPRGIGGISKRVTGIVPGINMGWNFHTWYFQ
ncbi:MAG: bac 5 protein [Dehalococcoidia bacterium]|nr:bac 5 protein [Dehalococcoidia bacterium]